MSRFFIALYRYFRTHRLAFWLSLVLSTVFFGFFALRVRLEQDMAAFFPETEDARQSLNVFSNLNVSDRVIVLLSEADGADPESARTQMLDAASNLSDAVASEEGQRIFESAMTEVGSGDIAGIRQFIMDNLPVLIDSAGLTRIDSLITPQAIDSKINSVHGQLLGPGGMVLKDFLLSDPLGFGSDLLARSQDMNIDSDYVLEDGHIFTPDGRTMLCFLVPREGSADMESNNKLVDFVESQLDSIGADCPDLELSYFCSAAVSAYNARRIAKDTIATSLIALLLIVVFILMAFKHRGSIFLILTPVAYGAVFALGLIGLFHGSVSAIAIGASSAILGIALNYSIHMLAQQNWVHSVEQLLEEVSGPLTIGSFTTIGAFVGLLFTKSSLLQDFGLFGALILVGTTLFCLIFLPQFLSARADMKSGVLLRNIDRISSTHLERNKPLVAALAILFVVCCFFSGKVGFNSNMMDLNYWEPKLKAAEEKLGAETAHRQRNVMIVSTGTTMEEAAASYAKVNARLDSLKSCGLIHDNADVRGFIVPPGEQAVRMERWKAFWAAEKKSAFIQNLKNAAKSSGFREDAFDGFINCVTEEPHEIDYLTLPELFDTYVSANPGNDMLVSRMRLDEDTKESVYQYFTDEPDVVVFDKSFITNAAASTINEDFNFILWFSSLLIFFALVVSYGRLELALLSFLPMFITWIIITGMMAILGIQFNIVNIILTTFIFGMGDDFSIFVLDGLMSKYKDGKSLLTAHKTAIFFSTFTIIVGIGVLIFAKHPALHSIAAISILGMLAVVVVSYVVEPLLFNLIVFKPTSKGMPPVTVFSIFRMIAIYGSFGLGCLVELVVIPLMAILPFKKSTRQTVACWITHITCRFSVWCTYFGKLLPQQSASGSIGLVADDNRWMTLHGLSRYKLDKPAIIIANHLSSSDIPIILALSPKIRMMANDKVLRTPVISFFLRTMGFYSRSEGYENQTDAMRRDIADGWSVAIFPEGTRSLTGEPGRFHKGAFYVAQTIGCDILPVVFYGNNYIWPKAKPFAMSKGLVVMRFLPRLTPEDGSMGTTYQERTKNVARLCRQVHADCRRIWDGPMNPYFNNILISNYIYKGPVVEYYVRVKTRMEDGYGFFHKVLPRKGKIVDLGCGMGQMDYMISLYSPEREVIGIDYDEKKIGIASNGWLRARCPKLDFLCADASETGLPEADAFVISDMLHYLSEARQHALLERCWANLRDGGMVLVRDSDEGNAEGQKVTSLTEWFSTRVFRFNKTEGKLSFTTDHSLKQFADSHGIAIEEHANDSLTSNTFYILRKRS